MIVIIICIVFMFSLLCVFFEHKVAFNMKKLQAKAACLLLATPFMAVAETDSNSKEKVEEVVIVSSASGFEQDIVNAPASISVITAEQLKKQSFTNVVDAIKNIPGVFMTGGGAMSDISIRGMSSAHTLYLVNGRPISQGRNVNTNGTDGGKQVGLPTISQIDRIEVIRGPMSSLYGSDAMGGIINIITKKPTSEWGGNVNAEWTHSMNDLNSDSQNMDFTVGGGLIKDLLGMEVSGSWQGTDESKTPTPDNKAGASTPDGENKEGTVKFVLTPDDNNTVELAYTKATRDYTHTPGKSLVATATAPSHTRFEKDIYVVSHDAKYDKFVINTYVQQDLSENTSDRNAEKKEDVVTVNTQASVFLGNHTLTLGGRYKKEKIVDETNGLYVANVVGALRENDRTLSALFTEVDWGLTDSWSVTTGLRYDHDEFFGDHLSPRLYSVYRATDDFSIKGGISTGYKQPSLAAATPGFGQRTGGGGSPNTDVNGNPISRALIIGNPELDPEKSTSYEIGYVYNNPKVGINTSLMLFHTEFKDKIAEDRYCTSAGAANNNDVANYSCVFGGNTYYFLSTSQNIDEANMQGVEFSLDYTFLNDYTLSSSYTYTRSEQKTGDFKGEPLNKMPRHMANLGFDWQATQKLLVWTQYNYRGKTSDYLSRTAMADGTPGYGFFDIGLVAQMTANVSIKAGLYNIDNKKVTNEDYGVVLDGRRLNLGLTVDF